MYSVALGWYLPLAVAALLLLAGVECVLVNEIELYEDEVLPNTAVPDSLAFWEYSEAESVDLTGLRTAQSSTHKQWVSSIALSPSVSCSTTTGRDGASDTTDEQAPDASTNEWWVIDLGSPVHVSSLSFSTKLDENVQQQMEYAQVYVLHGSGKHSWPADRKATTLCGVAFSGASKDAKHNFMVHCEQPVEGRYLYITPAKARVPVVLCSIDITVVRHDLHAYVNKDLEVDMPHTTSIYGPDEYEVSGTMVVSEPAMFCPTEAIRAGYPAADAQKSATQKMMTRQECEGKILLITRGECSFYDKTLLAQRCGALGVIIGNNRNDDTLFKMTWPVEEHDSLPVIHIPSVFISLANYKKLTRLAITADDSEVLVYLQGPSADDKEWDSTTRYESVSVDKWFKEIQMQTFAMQNKKNKTGNP